MVSEELELLLEPLMRQINIQKTNGNTPDALLMSTETLKKLTTRLGGETNKLDVLGVSIVLNEEIPYGKIGLSIEVPEENLEKTLEDLKYGV